MVAASELKPGMAIRHEGQNCKVVAVEHRGGQGKMGGVTHARLKNLSTGHLREHSFRADEKLEDLAIDKRSMEFLYSDEEQCHFMDPETFEQVAIDQEQLGPLAQLLQPEMKLPVQFLGAQALDVQFPDLIDVRIADTAPPVHQQHDSTWKSALVEGGLEIKVPLFIKTGEMIRLDTHKLEYRERAKS